MLQYVKGEIATLYCSYAHIDGSPVDPVNPVVGIWKDGIQVVADMPLSRISIGYYMTEWLVPMSMPTSEYSALYTSTIDGIVTQGEETFEITGAPSPIISDFYCTWDDINACLLGLDIGDIPATLQDRINFFHIPALKTEIDSYCRQNFNKTTITQFMDGSTTDKMAGFRRPISRLIYMDLKVIPSISWYTFKRWRHVNVVDSQGNTIAVQGGPEPIDPMFIPPYTYPLDPAQATWETTIEKADLLVDCANGIIIIPPRILYLEMQAIPFWNYTFLRGNKNVEVTYEYGYDDTNFPRDLRLAAAKLAACQILLLKGISVGGAGANSISMDGVSRNFGGTPYQALITDMRTQAFAILDRYRRLSV